MSEHIPFRIGELLQLQRLGEQSASSRYVVPLYGVCGEHSLISAAPRVNRKYAVISEGHLFAARMIIGSCAYGFQTEVLFSRQRPLPYLHLRYPKEFEMREVRSSARVSVRQVIALRAQINGQPGGESITAMALDISRSGLRAACTEPPAEIGAEVSVAAELSVAGARHRVRLPAVVRNIGEAVDESANMPWWVGLEFGELSDNELVILSGFVNEQLIASLS